MVNDDILLQESAAVCTSAGSRPWWGSADSHGRGRGHAGPLDAAVSLLGPGSCVMRTIAAWGVRRSAHGTLSRGR